MGVSCRRQIVSIKNYIAVHHLTWDTHAVGGFRFQTPAWRLDLEAIPPYALPCFDHEMLDAVLDENDIKLPRAFVLEAIDRALAFTVVDMFRTSSSNSACCCCSLVRYLAPADAVMRASTSYEATRGALTFASGTLSIGRLASTLVHHFTAAPTVHDNTSEEGGLSFHTQISQDVSYDANRPAAAALHSSQLRAVFRELTKLRRRVRASAGAKSRTQMERHLDLVLCSVLGQVGLDAARLGEHRSRVEAFVSLLTGLSSADLLRAKRLRDSRQLGERPDVLGMLRTIEELGATATSTEHITCADVRRRLEDEGVINPLDDKSGYVLMPSPPAVRGVSNISSEPPPQVVTGTLVRTSRPSTNYSFVVPALPVWSGATFDGELPQATMAPTFVFV